MYGSSRIGRGGHKAKKNLLHFSLNHGILSRMVLFLEKLDFFYFRTPSPPYWKIPTFFSFLFEPFPYRPWRFCKKTSVTIIDSMIILSPIGSFSPPWISSSYVLTSGSKYNLKTLNDENFLSNLLGLFRCRLCIFQSTYRIT